VSCKDNSRNLDWSENFTYGHEIKMFEIPKQRMISFRRGARVGEMEERGAGGKGRWRKGALDFKYRDVGFRGGESSPSYFLKKYW